MEGGRRQKRELWRKVRIREGYKKRGMRQERRDWERQERGREGGREFWEEGEIKGK